jgi:hypothetical protein
VLVHVVIVGAYHGPWVFADELGYQRLAESLGRSGDLALFGKRGLSYSPLYPLVLAPIYALHASAQSGYLWAKVVNCCLLALALLPIYKISRSLLARPQALVAAALAAFAPLMLFSSLEMSESLAYPLCLFAIWAMLASIRSPGWRRDAAVLGLCILCTATRLQFIVLLPAAIVAVAVDAALARGRPGSAPRRALAGLRAHRLLSAATAGLVLLALAALAGTAALSLAGRYANQDTLPIPSPWLMVKLVAWHVAGLVFSVAVIPFAGTLLAAWLWLRGQRSRPEVTSFAVVSLSVTAFIVLITAFASYGQSYAHGSGGDLPRIHERYMFYVLPLFLVAMLATTRLPRSTRLLRAGAAAALLTGLLPLIIPWRSVMNDTIAVDTFGFAPFAAAAKGGGIQAQPHAALLAAGLALCLGFVYVLARPNLAVLAAAVAATFVGVSVVAQSFLVTAARSAAGTTLPAKADWVDAAGVGGGVILVYPSRHSLLRNLAVEETAFYNDAVSRLYYTCAPLLGSDFGELQVHVDRHGQLASGGALLRAKYVVVSSDAGLQGRVLATDRPGRLVLLAPPGGVLRVSARGRPAWDCAQPKPAA